MPDADRLIVGVLLAAGAATRFGGEKLLAEIRPGRTLAESACAALLPAVDRLVAVVRPGADELAARLAAAGAEISVCPEAADGMGASLAHGVRHTVGAAGWLIALADMPLLATPDAQRVAAALRGGAALVVPEVEGRRAHPVGFAARFGDELAALRGDRGARTLIERHVNVVTRLAFANPHGDLDVDTADDLRRARLADVEGDLSVAGQASAADLRNGANSAG